MIKIHELKQQEAQLLGFDSYINLSLAKKMATEEDVMKLQGELAEAFKPLALRELAELTEFARTKLGLDKLEAFDIAFASEHLKKARFNLDDNFIREYFPEQRVIQGMCEVVRRLFGVVLIEEQHFDRWDPDAKLFSVYDSDETKLGEIYMDLYARSGEKRAGAWMQKAQVYLSTGDKEQLPIAFLSTNFTKGDGLKSSLLCHREVQTTFHEFGHCLHHILSKVPYPSLAGVFGVLWDVVEAPSQMMENWVWDVEGLKLFSGHCQTGEPLPKEITEALSKNKHFNAGMDVLQQLVYGVFDFNVYRQLKPHTSEGLHQLWLDTFRSIQVTPIDDYNHMPNGFHHIFSGGYSAGYYTYKWSLNMANDMFSVFKERGIFDGATCRAYRKGVLEPGGSEPFKTLLENFLGRELRCDASVRAIMGTPEVVEGGLAIVHQFNRARTPELNHQDLVDQERFLQKNKMAP